MNNNIKCTSIALFFLFVAISITNPIVANAQTGYTRLLTYKDPQGMFSINYPQGWDVKPATNRFQNYLVQFTQSQGGIGNSSAIFVITANNVTSDTRDYIIYNMIPNLNQSPLNIKITKGIECTKYMMSGHNACSLIYSGSALPNTSFERMFGAMAVATQVNGTLYLILFLSFPHMFQKNLPVVEKMISSFKIGPND